ncbi:S-methyl-5-thioribose kinase [Neptuniibacter sp. CAU 1671]|uniref:S-methyl-5-thioribose kinase n=1 Tax=Neptuniibacter sp. CAU 1671 TaxID=3032593 RepID=UPI0023DA8D48|nr:S-methyl-5-thioribose kinase [Neptuniibacter sp. CAU 1671]MDF2182032.1 S-methyl-5-thioribose kinase [Neptuniibacter sp. CAU 1671]
MSAHKFSSDAEIITFVLEHTQLQGDPNSFVVSEIGDGNINFVYRVSAADGKSMIVKQALPYVRIIGEGWPLSLDRIRIEAEALSLEGQYAPDYVPELYHFDSARAALVMQDIGDHENLRHALIARKPLPELGRHLGLFLANTLFYTSDLALDAHARKAMLGRFINPDLCKITEDLFFLDPYCDHERNNYNPLLADDVQALWQDEPLKAEVAELKYRFLNHAEALVHGDLHAGSVFVRSDSTQIIDPEFAYFGPIGFDVGSIIGNLLLNHCAQNGLTSDSTIRNEYQMALRTNLTELWQTFAETFSALMAEKTVDQTLQSSLWQQQRLAQILSDSLGYAGTELIRRTIGLAGVADLNEIADENVRAASERQALKLGVELIKSREQLRSFDDVLTLLTTV